MPVLKHLAWWAWPALAISAAWVIGVWCVAQYQYLSLVTDYQIWSDVLPDPAWVDRYSLALCWAKNHVIHCSIDYGALARTAFLPVVVGCVLILAALARRWLQTV